MEIHGNHSLEELATEYHFEPVSVVAETEEESVTIHMDTYTLNKRPAIKEAIKLALDPKGTVEISDDDLVDILNADEFISGQMVELIHDMGEISELEGEPTYRPSILDINDSTEIEKIINNGGFREDYDEIPHKYSLLSPDILLKVLSNPQLRTVLARVKSTITDELVTSMTG